MSAYDQPIISSRVVSRHIGAHSVQGGLTSLALLRVGLNIKEFSISKPLTKMMTWTHQSSRERGVGWNRFAPVLRLPELLSTYTLRIFAKLGLQRLVSKFCMEGCMQMCLHDRC